MSQNGPKPHDYPQICKQSGTRHVPNKTAFKPLILAIETSGRIGSVALAVGKQLLDERAFSAPMRHSAEIFTAAGQLLGRFGQKPKEIEHIYISAGPGSFTGLRIATAMAKSMHLGNGTQIVAVDTLDVIAANATDYVEKQNIPVVRIATILDAKRSQFFIAVYQYEHGNWTKKLADCLMTAGQFLDKYTGTGQDMMLLGEGLVYHKDIFKAEGISFFDEQYWYPKASKVHLLGLVKALEGQFADPLTLEPMYLRRPDIREKQY